MAWTTEQILRLIQVASPAECITEASIVDLTGLSARHVETSCLLLRKHKLLTKTARGCHRLTDAGREAIPSTLRSGPKGPEQHKRVWRDTLRMRVWRAIRVRRKFGLDDLIGLVAEGTERGDIGSNVRKYVRALTVAGILVEMPRRVPDPTLGSNGLKRWWLPDEKDLGPLAPVWSARKKRVYDPNSETEIAL